MVNHGSWLMIAEPYSKQPTVTDWPMRLLLTAATILVILALLWLLWHSWHRRAKQQGGYSALCEPLAFKAHESFRCKYAGTAQQADLWSRVVAGGGPAWGELQFGVLADHEHTSHAERTVCDRPDALRIERGLTLSPITIPYEAIRAVGRSSGMLQKGYAGHGLILVTWDALPGPVTSGLWLPSRDDFEACLARLPGHATLTSEVGS